MKGSLRQSMAWMHTWTGLLVGWVLFAMFCTGTATYFRSETTRWMEPETGLPSLSTAQAAAAAQAFLTGKAPSAQSWNITLPDERQATTSASWRPQPKPGEEDRPRRRGGGRGNRATLDANTGEVVQPRETRGGEFFYRFHFQMHYVPVMTGRWMAGAFAMFMLLAIISGIITHKRFFKDIFTFRPGKAAQRSWLDAHNMTAVLALPFHIMITYTGLITLMNQYMPWPALANYPTQREYFAAAFPQPPELERTGHPAKLAPLPLIIESAERAWGGRAWIVNVQNPGDASARVQVTRHSGDKLNYSGGTLLFDGVSGRMLSASPADGPASVTGHVMYGLHMGRFADPLLRWGYFLASLTGCAMVATGLVLWTVKRRQQLPDPDKPYFGFRLVEKLNIGSIAGVPAGMAGMLWANRLLPAGVAERSSWEVHAMFMVWGTMILWACVRPVRRAWVETLGAAAAIIALLPVVNALTSNRNIVSCALNGDWAMVAYDLTLLALGALVGYCALKAWRYRPPIKASARRKAAAVAAPEAEAA